MLASVVLVVILVIGGDSRICCDRMILLTTQQPTHPQNLVEMGIFDFMGCVSFEWMILQSYVLYTRVLHVLMSLWRYSELLERRNPIFLFICILRILGLGSVLINYSMVHQVYMLSILLCVQLRDAYLPSCGENEEFVILGCF